VRGTIGRRYAQFRAARISLFMMPPGVAKHDRLGWAHFLFTPAQHLAATEP
jgi:hypothetical protein